MRQILNYRPGEGSLLFSLLGLGFFGFLATVLVRTSTYSLYLNSFEYQSLPLVFIASAAVAMALATLSLILMRRVPLSYVLLGNTIVMCALLMLLRGVVGWTQAPWAVFSLPVAFHILMPVMMTSYWALVQRLFNIQQSRRLTGIVASSETLAMIAGGFVTPLIVRLAGSVNVLLGAVASLLVYAAILLALLSRHRNLLGTRPTPTPDRGASSGAMTNRRYVSLIMLSFALFVMSAYFVDNIFYGFAQIQISEPDALTTFLGRFWGVAGILIFLTQTLFAGRMLGRYGVGPVLMCMPLALVVGGTLLAAAGLLGAPTTLVIGLVIALEMMRTVLDATDQTASNVLFQPLAEQTRTEAQTLTIGVVYPGALGVTGVALLLCFNVLQLNLFQVTGVTIIVALIWSGVSFWLGRRYPQALSEALDRRTIRPVDLTMLDASSRAVLRSSLNSPDEAIVTLSLSLLEELDPQSIEASLPQLMKHPQAAVRLAAIASVARLQLATAVPQLQAQLSQETVPAVRGALLASIGTLGDVGAGEFVRQFATDSEPAVRRGAWVGWLGSPISTEQAAVVAALEKAAHGADPKARLFAADVIAASGHAKLTPLALDLLGDELPEVRRAGLRASQRIHDQRLWPTVVDCLADHQTRAAARAALISAQAAALPAIEKGFTTYRDDPSTGAALSHVLSRIDDSRAIELLEEWMGDPHERLRTATITALARQGYQATASTTATIVRQVDDEVAYAAWLAAALSELAPAVPANGPAATDLIYAALRNQLVRVRVRLISLLGFLYGPAQLARVGVILQVDSRDESVTSLDHSERQRRAYALETLAVLLPAERKEIVTAILDGRPPPEVQTALASVAPQTRKSSVARLREIIRHPDEWPSPWIKATAIDAAGRLPAPSLASYVEKNLNAPDALIREAACWTLEQFEPDEVNESAAQPVHGRGNIMLTTIEKIIALKGCRFFTGLDDDVLIEAAAFVDVRTVATGKEIFAKGDHGDTLYVVASGRVRLCDDELVLGELVPYQAFGEFALLDPAPRSATAVAVETTTLLTLDQVTFNELIDDQSSIARRIMQLLVRRIRNANLAVADAATEGSGSIE